MDILIEKIKIDSKASIIQALRKMDEVGHKMLLVFIDRKFYSILTIGDIQRAIIHAVDLSSSIVSILNIESKKYVTPTDSEELVKQQMLAIRAEFMPVVDEMGELVGLYQWSDFFPAYAPEAVRKKIDLPVVIMAGGLGTRLKPLTNVIPKPLIPIGEKTILEQIMDQFESIGCSKFYLSVNYKCEILKFYLKQLQHQYDIDFFQEQQPLGTIGSVSLLKDKITTPFFVSNCDIIVDQDFRDVYEYHCENKNDLTVVTAVKSYKIPYGVVEAGDNGVFVNITEKPEWTYKINTGVYVLNPEVVAEIPKNQFFHITHLMEKLKEKGGKIGCFPISEKSWTDMGEWSEYLKLISR